MKSAVQREILLAPEFKSDSSGVDIGHRSEDTLSAGLMENATVGVPIQTMGDGDCLFNAVSILLSGDELLSVELRYRSCIQLLTKQTRYIP